MKINCTDSGCQPTASFKALRYCPGYKFSEAQKGVFENLKMRLNTPVSKNEKISLIPLLERNGYDLFVSPEKEADKESLKLFLTNKMDKQDFSFKDFGFKKEVGVFSKSQPITYDIIEKLLNLAKDDDSRRKSFVDTMWIAFATATATIAGCVGTAYYMNQDSYSKDAQTQEVVKDSTEKLPPDTVVIEKFEYLK